MHMHTAVLWTQHNGETSTALTFDQMVPRDCPELLSHAAKDVSLSAPGSNMHY
jgi:hypothetical protein